MSYRYRARGGLVGGGRFCGLCLCILLLLLPSSSSSSALTNLPLPGGIVMTGKGNPRAMTVGRRSLKQVTTNDYGDPTANRGHDPPAEPRRG